MSDDFITVSAGGPSPDADIPDGVYPVILSAISDPKTVTARRGKNAGKDIDLIDWTFAVDAPGHPLDARLLDESTSTASGPRSKMYAYLTALFGGVAPVVGTRIGKADLIGRRALATVVHDEGGWPRVSNLGALPAQMLQQSFAAATGAPVQAPGAPAPAAAAAQPLREAVGAGVGAADFQGAPTGTPPASSGDLPF